MSTPLHLESIADIVDRHVDESGAIAETILSCVNRIEAVNSEYNAVVWSDTDFTQQQISRTHEQRNDTTKKYALLGVPLLVKEIDSPIAGTPNSLGLAQLKDANYCDKITSTAISRLVDAGAIITGKTNNPELALTVTTDSTAHGPCNNPLDVTRNSGGSSGGSAAAVASGIVSVATASDGGGSARIPASNCGVYGYKPSRGLIPLGPLYEEAWAGLVCKGLVASNVDDLVKVLNVVAQKSFATNNLTERLRIGIRTTGFGSIYSMNKDVVSATEKVASYLSDKGHFVEHSHPRCYDSASFIQHFLNVIARHTFLDLTLVKNVLLSSFDIDLCDPVTQYFYSQGAVVSDSEYKDAETAIDVFTDDNDEWFNDFDILITPTCGNVAPLHGEVEGGADTAPLVYGGLCMPSNVSGTPAISVPVCTEHETGLPVGVQIVAARGNDQLALQLAHQLETDYSDIFVTPHKDITS